MTTASNFTGIARPKSGRGLPMAQWKCSRARSISTVCSLKQSLKAETSGAPNKANNSMSINVAAATVMGALIGDDLAGGAEVSFGLIKPAQPATLKITEEEVDTVRVELILSIIGVTR